MEQIKTLIKYSDWLLLNRGEIKPEIGDILFDTTNEEYVQVDKKDFNLFKTTEQIIDYFSKCYVEINYNPNEAIEFFKWVDANYFYFNENKCINSTKFKQKQITEIKTLKEIYQQFKQERYGKE